jgi:hypothetical protein
LWFTFFFPLSANIEFENAFGLTYYTVHILCLYVGCAIFALSSWPIYQIFCKPIENDKKKIKDPFDAFYFSVCLAMSGSIAKSLHFINY